MDNWLYPNQETQYDFDIEGIAQPRNSLWEKTYRSKPNQDLKSQTQAGLIGVLLIVKT